MSPAWPGGVLVAGRCPAQPARANKDIERLQIQIAALQGQIADLQRVAEDTQREIKRLNESLAEQNAFLRKSDAGPARCRTRRSQTALREIDERVAELERAASQGAAAPRRRGRRRAARARRRPAPGGARRPGRRRPRRPRPRRPRPRELYSQAYADYARGNYDLAIQGYQRVPARTTRTPTSPTTRSTGSASACTRSRSTPEAIEAWDELLRALPVERQAARRALQEGHGPRAAGPPQPGPRRVPRAWPSAIPNSEAGRKAREKLNPNERLAAPRAPDEEEA